MRHASAFVAVFFLASTLVAYAAGDARLYIEYPQKELAPSSRFPVRILLDSVDAINALSITVQYSPHALKLHSIHTRSSFIDFWTERSSDDVAGNITLEGGVRDAFSGHSGEIATLVFDVRASSSVAAISFTDAYAYQADGMGTRIELDFTAVPVVISESGTLVLFEEKDTKSPVFEEVERGGHLLDGAPFVAFHVTDDNQGALETHARFFRWFFWSDWAPAKTPVRFDDSVWALQLRAADSAGNTAYHTQVIPRALLLPLLILLICALAIGVWVRLRGVGYVT